MRCETKCEYYKAVLDSMRGGEYSREMDGDDCREEMEIIQSWARKIADM